MNTLMDKTINKRKPVETQELLKPLCLQRGYKNLFISNPGSGKTTFMNWLAYQEALLEGKALILDFESPRNQVEGNLERYSLWMNRDWHQLPITLITGDDASWEDLAKDEIDALEPLFIGLESITALSEDLTNPKIGKLIKKTLAKLTERNRLVTITAHTRQESYHLTIEELKHCDIPEVVNGNTSIVSQGCDFAYIIKQISETPLRIVIIPRSRRGALNTEPSYWELQEPDGYGQGRMWWTQIAPVKPELSENAIRVYDFIKARYINTGKLVTSDVLVKHVDLRPEERRGIINELRDRKLILEVKPFEYKPFLRSWKHLSQEKTEELLDKGEDPFGVFL